MSLLSGCSLLDFSWCCPGKKVTCHSGRRIHYTRAHTHTHTHTHTRLDAATSLGATLVHAHANRQDYNFAKRQQMENWANQQKQWTQERAMRDSQAQMEGIARQKNTDDYKDFLMSGRSNDDMTASDMENVIFATGAQGYDNSELLKKSDWKPCKVLPV